MRFTILSALLSVASVVCATAQSSGTVGYNRTTLSVAPTNLIFRAASITSKITNASIYGITGILKGDGIGGSVLATPGVDYEPAGGGGTTVSVNGSEVSTPNFTNSATATFSVTTTNVSVNPTNLSNAQIAAGAAIDFSKLSGVAASVHVHAGEDITSGTVAAARIDSAIATDAEVAAGFQPLDSDLTALAGNGSNGLLARTGSGTVAARTITGDSEITVSNGDGVGGNPTLAIASSIARDSEVSSAVANVIHSNVSGEITAITDKATPVAADHILIEDSAASDAKKDITIASLETAFEGFLDLQDLQGAVTDAQVPNTITVDLATLATTATIANSGDSATAFFSSGEIEDARLPSTLTRDSEWDTIGEIETATSANIIVSTEVDSIGELETLLGAVNVILATEIDTQAELEAISGVSFATDSEVAAGYQPLDADLTAVAGLSASGLISRTGSGTVATRTITGDSEITVSDGDGVSGNPTLAIAAALARDAEVAAAYQPLDADLTDLADGSLTGSKVGTGISADNVTGGTITGSGGLVRASSPTLTTPVIADFTTAQHNHQNAAGGGALSADSITSGAFDAARLGSGSAYFGNSLTPWVDTNNVISLRWRKTPQIWEFIGAAGEWTAYTANSGAVSLSPFSLDNMEFGSWRGSTGTLTNGLSGFRSTITAGIPATNTMALLLRIKTPSNLSSSTDGYELINGFADTASDAAQVDGAYIYYNHDASSSWIGRTADNGSVTPASGGASVTVTANTWWNLLIEVSSTLANFWVSSNDGLSWQWIGSSTSNIPTAADRYFGVMSGIRKVGPNPGGTTAQLFYLGRCELWPASIY